MLDNIFSWLTVKTLLVGLVTGLLAYWFSRKMRYRLPPGPFALPVVGNMLQFRTYMIHEEVFQMTKYYGPVISIYLGPQLAIFVNDIKSATEVLIRKGADFASRPRAPSTDAFTNNAKDIIFGQNGPTWRLHRKISSKALRHFMQGDMLDERIHNAVRTILEEMKKEAAPFDPVKYINFLVGNILLGLCYGESFKFDDKDLNRLIELDNQVVDELGGLGLPEDWIPGLKYVWESPGLRRLKSFLKEVMDTIIGKKYWEHIKSFDKDNIRDFADMLILARQEAESDPDESDLDKLTDTHIMQTLFDIFFAGIDTSRLSLRFAILHMVANPEIQKKVQEEVDRVVGFDELPSLRHRPDLSYTEAVLHECMRLSNILPIGVPHLTTCDTKIGSFDVPKDTMEVVNLWALHHDPAAWENVNAFIPERFLDKDGKMGPKPENWLPFSAGRRVCLGESVAKPELHLLFACLMQRFTWRLLEGEKVDLTPTGNSFGLLPKLHQLIVVERVQKAKLFFLTCHVAWDKISVQDLL